MYPQLMNKNQKQEYTALKKAIERVGFDLDGRFVINATATVALQVRYTGGKVANRQCQ